MDNRGNIVIYQTKDGKTSIDVKLENETVWLHQNKKSNERCPLSEHVQFLHM